MLLDLLGHLDQSGHLRAHSLADFHLVPSLFRFWPVDTCSISFNTLVNSVHLGNSPLYFLLFIQNFLVILDAFYNVTVAVSDLALNRLVVQNRIVRLFVFQFKLLAHYFLYVLLSSFAVKFESGDGSLVLLEKILMLDLQDCCFLTKNLD